MTKFFVDVNVVCTCTDKLKATYTDNEIELPLCPTLIVEPCEACMDDASDEFVKHGIAEAEDRLSGDAKKLEQALKCEIGVRTYFENELNRIAKLLGIESIEEIYENIEVLLKNNE